MTYYLNKIISFFNSFKILQTVIKVILAKLKMCFIKHVYGNNMEYSTSTTLD